MCRGIVATENAPKPVGPYAQGRIAGGLLLTAGQIGLDPMTGTLVPGGIEAPATGLRPQAHVRRGSRTARVTPQKDGRFKSVVISRCRFVDRPTSTPTTHPSEPIVQSLIYPTGHAAAGARMMDGGRPAACPADTDLGHGRRHDVELIAAVGVRASGVDRPAARRTAPIRAAGAWAQHIDHAPHTLPQFMDDFRDQAPAVPPRRRAADATGIRTERLLAPRRGR
jgi:Endoribonuclease L-PSP